MFYKWGLIRQGNRHWGPVSSHFPPPILGSLLLSSQTPGAPGPLGLCLPAALAPRRSLSMGTRRVRGGHVHPAMSWGWNGDSWYIWAGSIMECWVRGRPEAMCQQRLACSPSRIQVLSTSQRGGLKITGFVYINPILLIYPYPHPFPFGNHKYVFYVCESLLCIK